MYDKDPDFRRPMDIRCKNHGDYSGFEVRVFQDGYEMMSCGLFPTARDALDCGEEWVRNCGLFQIDLEDIALIYQTGEDIERVYF